MSYQPRYIASVYYAPDDPHVTNPSQPGYVGSNQSTGAYSGGGGGTAPDGSQAPPGFSVPAQGGTGYQGDLPGGGYSGSPGVPGSYGTPTYQGPPNLTATGQPFAPGFSLNNGVWSMSPAGEQAPTHMWNVDMSTGSIYPPGQSAPANGTQLNTDNAGLAMAAAFMPPPPPGQFNSDYYVAQNPSGGYDVVVDGKRTTYATQQEAERAYNDALAKGGSTGYGNAATPPAGGATVPPAQQGGAEYDTTKQFWAGPDAGFLTRPEAIARLRQAGSAENLDALTNTQLAQSMANAFNVGQERRQAELQQQQYNDQKAQAEMKTKADQLGLLERLLADAPAMAPQLVPQINALLAAMGLPQLPPNEAQLLMASLAGSSLGGRAAPSRIAFAPLAG